MEPSVSTDIFIEPLIFSKKYHGVVTLDFIFNTWREAIRNEEFPLGVKNFIIDYTEADIQFSTERIVELVNFYKDLDSIFGNAKIAMVMVTPNQVVFPYLMEMQGVNFTLKTFYTKAAAIDWLNS